MAVSFKGAIFVLALVVTTSVGCLMLFSPTVLLLLFSLKAYRLYTDFTIQIWLTFVTALVELVFGVKVRISGDLRPLSQNGPTLIVMNHRTRFDWLFFWCFLLRQGKLSHLKIILKKSLKSIPAFGWAMQHVNYIFLHRKWSQDEANLKRTLQYFADNLYPVQLLLFPEGTDLSPGNRKRDKEFAEKKGLTVYEYVLHPRNLGFVSCVQGMNWSGAVAICDLTVGYVGSIAQNESDILAGSWPTEIHFHSKLVPGDQFPAQGSTEELATWLTTCWENKEQMLQNFYEKKSFPGPKLQDAKLTWFKMVGSILFWVVICVVFLYGVVAVPYTWLCVLTMISMYVIVDKAFGGMDTVVYWVHDRKKHS